MGRGLLSPVAAPGAKARELGNRTLALSRGQAPDAFGAP